MAKKLLRSNLEVGSSRWATRRAQWRALGISDEDMEKPKIAVVNSSSKLAICFSHLDDIAHRVEQVIRDAGGLPLEIRTAAPSDFITSAGHKGGYILSARDLIANDIEIAVEGALLDGMICLASCDKTAPGQLMAAGRLNIPTIIVACGYQQSGRYRGAHVDIEDVFLNAGNYRSGKIGFGELRDMSENAVRGPGVCAGMGTANSMHIASEALGMALPGSTPVAANSERMWAAVDEAARRIVQMVWDDLKPRDVMTPAAFRNAVTAMLAICGSVNSVKHLQAIATEAQSGVDVYGLFEGLADEVPLLSGVRPNGDHTIEDFEAAGGARALMSQLGRLIDGSAPTVSGQLVRDNLRDATVADPTVIRPLERPLATRPAIVLVRGSLAPACGIVKLGAADDRVLRHVGRAVVYESADAALDGIARGEVQPGHVLVLRGQGPRGTPGMGLTSAVAFALEGRGLMQDVPFVTDGQTSGLLNVGIVVGEVAPEAAEGGPLALVQPGDRITIDVERRRIDLEVPDSVLAARRASLRAMPQTQERGWLAIYRRNVGPLSRGAVLTGDDHNAEGDRGSR